MGISLNPSTILSGQGINVSSVVQQIINAQSGQLSVWQQEQTNFATANGVLEGINNNLTSLQTAVAALASPTGALAAVAATSSQPGIVTATAQATAVAGTHQIVVSNLATTGALYTASVAAGANASFLSSGQTSGDLQLQVGGAGGSAHDIAITLGANDTLNTLATSINTQSTANSWGVTATVVSDANGSRLALFSQSPGAAGALGIVANTNTTLTFDSPTGGTNASFTVDGVPFSSSSNTVSGAIQGVTLNLASQSPGTTVQISVGPDTNQILTAVNNFVSAYNTTVGSINSQYVVDPTGAIPAPPLEASISLRALQSSLLADASFAIGGNGGYVNLASLGINTNNDGTLSLGPNAAGQTLSTILASNPSAVQSFFQNASAGFANNFNSDLTNLTSPTTGPLYVELTQNQTEQADLTKSITSFQTQLSSEQVQLTSRYNAVNASLQTYPLILQATTQVLGSLAPYGTASSGATGPTLTSGL